MNACTEELGSADESEVPLNRMAVRRFTQDRWRQGCTPGSTTSARRWWAAEPWRLSWSR